MYCKHCGAYLHNTSENCPNCGRNIRAEKTSSRRTKISSNGRGYSTEDSSSSSFPQNKSTQKKALFWMVFAIGMIALIGLIIEIFMLIQKGNEPDEPTLTEAITQTSPLPDIFGQSVSADETLAQTESVPEQESEYQATANDGEVDATNRLSRTYGQFSNLQGFPVSDKQITTYAGFNIPFPSASYIDGEKDYCTIVNIYENGWVKVSYPVSTGTKTAYCYLSDFFDYGNLVELYSTHTTDTADVCSRSDMENIIGAVWKTDKIYVIADNGIQVQIIYPIDSGGWKLGWIWRSFIVE